MSEYIIEIGPDGELLGEREPLPAFELELCSRNGWMLVSSDDFYHFFASGTKALCGSTTHGIVGSGNWRVVDCPDCRAIGQGRQPLLMTPASRQPGRIVEPVMSDKKPPMPPRPPTVTADGLPETFNATLHRDAVVGLVQKGRVDPYTVALHIECLRQTASEPTPEKPATEEERAAAQLRVARAVAELYSIHHNDAVAVVELLPNLTTDDVRQLVEQVRVK